MANRDPNQRSNCKHVLNNQDKWTLNLTEDDIPQEFLSQIRSIDNNDKSMKHLTHYCDYQLTKITDESINSETIVMDFDLD